MSALIEKEPICSISKNIVPLFHNGSNIDNRLEVKIIFKFKNEKFK